MSRFQATLVSDGRTDAQVHGRRRMNLWDLPAKVRILKKSRGSKHKRI